MKIKIAGWFTVIFSAVLWAVPVAAKAWDSDSYVVLNESRVVSEQACANTKMSIFVRGVEDLVEACVHGSSDKLRLAEYALNGSLRYGVSSPNHAYFVPLEGVCEIGNRCMYGQAADVLLTYTLSTAGQHLKIIKNFSSSLTKSDSDPFTYTLPDSVNYEILMHGDAYARVGAMTVSPSGLEAAIEVRRYGFLKLNLKTLTAKRVVAPGAEYGYGYDPIFELALSRDGGLLAITGRNTGLRIYELQEECGDTLVTESDEYFSTDTNRCKLMPLNTQELFPGLIQTNDPRFSNDGKALELTITTSGGVKRSVIAPTAYDTSSYHHLNAFGDSYTSGEGEVSDDFYIPTSNTPQSRCHVSIRSYPYLVASRWGMPGKNNACSGARINQVKDALISAEPLSRVTISVGGNDIALFGKIKTCLGPGTCEWARPEKRAANIREMQQILPAMSELIDTARNVSPSAQIAIVGYPRVISINADAYCSPVIRTLLNHEERVFIDESIQYLNRLLKASASANNVAYIDVQEALHGYKLCDKDESAMNAVRLGDDFAPITFIQNMKLIGAESFHPTPFGHQKVADAITTHGAWWQPEQCEDCLKLDPPPGYWSESVSSEATAMQSVREFLEKIIVHSQQVIRVRFPVGTFAPSSDVRLEIHSDPQEIGKYTAAPDGSLDGEIIIPQIDGGYHTVHVYGEDASGERVDLYEIVAVNLEVDSMPVGAPTGRFTEYPHQQGSYDNPPYANSIKSIALTSTYTAVNSQPATVKTASLHSSPQDIHTPTHSSTGLILIILVLVGSGIGWIVFKRNSDASHNTGIISAYERTKNC